MALSLCLAVLDSPRKGNAQAKLDARPDVAGTSASVSAAGTAEGLIKLDVVVTDQLGKPVAGLDRDDFTLLDEGEASRIVAFQAFDGVSAKASPPVEVIVVMDTMNLPGKLEAYEKREVDRFLRQDGGRLAQPVSIFWLSDRGLWSVARPSGDGNALAAELGQSKGFPLSPRAVRGSTQGRPGFGDSPGLLALKALGEIAAAQSRKPGRKLLLWVGPGWGPGSGRQSSTGLDRAHLFEAIQWFSILMREARVTLFSLPVGESDPRVTVYQDYLAGVKAPKLASDRNLDEKVLAVQGGGRVLAASEDLVSRINDCAGEARVFYTISFNPAKMDGRMVADSARSAEFRRLEVRMGKPGLTARANTGYYDQPYFYDERELGVRRITVGQLAQALSDGGGKPDGELARQLAGVELTERLGGAELVALQARLRGAKARAALVALADESAFLAPAEAEVPADAPPNVAEQRRMVSLGAEYLEKTNPKLPNFFAVRKTIRYEESQQHFDDTGTNRTDYEPLHPVGSSKETVLYRNGREDVESAKAKRSKPGAGEPGLTTEGTFGPILGAVRDAIEVPGGLTWSRWERGAGGLEAVFRYAVPEKKSKFDVGYCCRLDGDGTGVFHALTGYHGQIAIDPASGTILRLSVESDLKPSLPMLRSDILVEYGPVEIGARTYICPVRSVSVVRARTIKILTGFSQSFRTFGPYSTMLNDVSFANYHLFRSESRILTGFDPELDQK